MMALKKNVILRSPRRVRLEGLWFAIQRNPGYAKVRLTPGMRLGNQRRNTISFLISAMAFAGLRFFGQVRVQFMIVWQR